MSNAESGEQSADKADEERTNAYDAPDTDDDSKPSNGKREMDQDGKPVPDEGDKEKVADMMTAYEERPTLVLPGSGKTITGTAVNDWLDDEGDPKYSDDQDAPAAKARNRAGSDTPTKSETTQDETAESESKSETSERNLSETSDRGARADQTAQDADKSDDQINKEAEEAVKKNFDKDKEFNEAVLKAANDDSEKASS